MLDANGVDAGTADKLMGGNAQELFGLSTLAKR
jgi:hypothetical protein